MEGFLEEETDTLILKEDRGQRERGSWDEIGRLCPEYYYCLHFPYGEKETLDTCQGHTTPPEVKLVSFVGGWN